MLARAQLIGQKRSETVYATLFGPGMRGDAERVAAALKRRLSKTLHTSQE